MAAALLAMNDVYGRFFDVSPDELYEPAAHAQAAPPKDLFVFDDQLHLVRGSRPSPADLRAVAQGPSSAPRVKSNPYNPRGQRDERGDAWGVWNPALVGLPIDPAYAHITQFIKDVYLDSQVTIGLLSNVTASMVQVDGEPPRPPRNAEEAQRGEILTAAQTAAARNFVNEISGSTRMLCHGLLYVGKGNLPFIQEQIDKHEPDSWKGYNISNSAKVDDDPNSLMRQWRHDDAEVAYPTFELIQKNYDRLKGKKPGFNNICVHKGLAPGPPDPKRGHPDDLPKAARDWPKLNFITYHACIQPNFFLADTLEEVKAGKLRGGVPDIRWTTEYAQLVAGPAELLRRDRHDVGVVGGDVPDDRGAHPGPAPEVPGRGPGRVRVGLGLVRVAAVADRGAVAVPDPRGAAREVRLPGAHRAGQAEDPGADLGQVVRDQGRGPGRVPCRPEGLRVADDRGAEDRPGVRPAEGGG